jgi:hypothetical protein
MFAHTAMSLGMEQEDLLFNLLYFGGEGAAPDINMAISNARDETVALHSENNTPYKLRPASTTDIEQLKSEALRSLDELVEIRLLAMRGRRMWRLKQTDGQALLIPVDAEGAEKLFDVFAGAARDFLP